LTAYRTSEQKAAFHSLPAVTKKIDPFTLPRPIALTLDQNIRSYLLEEAFMSTFVTVGKRLIPHEHIAFVELYDPSANSKIQTSRDFLARVMLVNRDSILIEETPEAFAKANEFRMLAEDNVAVNPVVRFQVETFEPSEGFNPSKPYASRLRWRDLDGNDQSKLLLSKAESRDVLAR
jgi:hypothetical protein